LRIEGNQISNAYGVNVQVHAASQVRIVSNVFIAPGRLVARDGAPRTIDSRAVIFMEAVNGATVAENRLVLPGPHVGERPMIIKDGKKLEAENPFVR
jgi:hypothetical protein